MRISTASSLNLLSLLLIQYVAASASGHSAEAALKRKEKQPLPLPLCCFRFRPSKPAFMYVVKVRVLLTSCSLSSVRITKDLRLFDDSGVYYNIQSFGRRSVSQVSSHRSTMCCARALGATNMLPCGSHRSTQSASRGLSIPFSLQDMLISYFLVAIQTLSLVALLCTVL